MEIALVVENCYRSYCRSRRRRQWNIRWLINLSPKTLGKIVVAIILHLYNFFFFLVFCFVTNLFLLFYRRQWISLVFAFIFRRTIDFLVSLRINYYHLQSWDFSLDSLDHIPFFTVRILFLFFLPCHNTVSIGFLFISLCLNLLIFLFSCVWWWCATVLIDFYFALFSSLLRMCVYVYGFRS